MRTHADAARAYRALKRRLAQRFPEDIDAYCDGKDGFVRSLQDDAVAWMEGRVRLLPVTALRDRPDLIDRAAAWFSSRWGVPAEDYRASMAACTRRRAPVPQWYVMVDGERIAAGAGVIDNDFHTRHDLAPNVCAVYVQPEYLRLGAARRLPDAVCRDMAGMGIDRLYLLTDHDGFYERLGWRFEDMVRDDAGEFGRMYVHSAT